MKKIKDTFCDNNKILALALPKDMQSLHRKKITLLCLKTFLKDLNRRNTPC